MSTPAHSNDELFRQKLEDYREMPSPAVWEGVEAALDQEKKKRRFLFWLWFGGAGTSLAAALLLIPVFLGETATPSNPIARTAQHVAPTADLALGRHSSATSPEPGAVPAFAPNTGSPILADGTSDASTATQTPRHARTPSRAVRSQTPKHAADPSKKQNAVLARQQPEQSPIVEPQTASAHVPAVRQGEPSRTIPALNPISWTALATEKRESALATLPIPEIRPQLPVSAVFPRVQPTITVQGYSGGVAYRRGNPQTDPSSPPIANNVAKADDTTGKQKKFGIYGGATLKAGLVINRHWYVNVGIGYETHYFADRYRFQVPGAILDNQDTIGLTPPTAVVTEGFTTNTAFGNALIPLQATGAPDMSNGIQYIEMKGKLVYQLQQLILPIDFGYRYSHKRFGVYVGGSAAFHVPLSQRAVFYADSGPVRIVQLNPTAPFNFSVGVEPGLEYNFAKRFSLLAGGSFRYQLLNAHKSDQPTRPYVLAGHLGIRVSL